MPEPIDLSIDELVEKAQREDVELRDKRRRSKQDPLSEEALRGPPVQMPRLDGLVMKHIPVGSRNWGIVLRYCLGQITSGVWKNPMSDGYDFFRYFCGLSPRKAHDFAEEIYDKARRVITETERQKEEPNRAAFRDRKQEID